MSERRGSSTPQAGRPRGSLRLGGTVFREGLLPSDAGRRRSVLSELGNRRLTVVTSPPRSPCTPSPMRRIVSETLRKEQIARAAASLLVRERDELKLETVKAATTPQVLRMLQQWWGQLPRVTPPERPGAEFSAGPVVARRNAVRLVRLISSAVAGETATVGPVIKAWVAEEQRSAEDLGIQPRPPPSPSARRASTSPRRLSGGTDPGGAEPVCTKGSCLQLLLNSLAQLVCGGSDISADKISEWLSDPETQEATAKAVSSAFKPLQQESTPESPALPTSPPPPPVAGGNSRFSVLIPSPGAQPGSTGGTTSPGGERPDSPGLPTPLPLPLAGAPRCRRSRNRSLLNAACPPGAVFVPPVEKRRRASFAPGVDGPAREQAAGSPRPGPRTLAAKKRRAESQPVISAEPPPPPEPAPAGRSGQRRVSISSPQSSALPVPAASPDPDSGTDDLSPPLLASSRAESPQKMPSARLPFGSPPPPDSPPTTPDPPPDSAGCYPFAPRPIQIMQPQQAVVLPTPAAAPQTPTSAAESKQGSYTALVSPGEAALSLELYRGFQAVAVEEAAAALQLTEWHERGYAEAAAADALSAIIASAERARDIADIVDMLRPVQHTVEAQAAVPSAAVAVVAIAAVTGYTLAPVWPAAALAAAATAAAAVWRPVWEAPAPMKTPARAAPAFLSEREKLRASRSGLPAPRSGARRVRLTPQEAVRLIDGDDAESRGRNGHRLAKEQVRLLHSAMHYGTDGSQGGAGRLLLGRASRTGSDGGRPQQRQPRSRPSSATKRRTDALEVRVPSGGRPRMGTPSPTADGSTFAEVREVSGWSPTSSPHRFKTPPPPVPLTPSARSTGAASEEAAKPSDQRPASRPPRPAPASADTRPLDTPQPPPSDPAQQPPSDPMWPRPHAESAVLPHRSVVAPQKAVDVPLRPRTLCWVNHPRLAAPLADAPRRGLLRHQVTSKTPPSARTAGSWRRPSTGASATLSALDLSASTASTGAVAALRGELRAARLAALDGGAEAAVKCARQRYALRIASGDRKRRKRRVRSPAAPR
eukprot:TRINITY_DN24920_c0_g1_i2.p1 TRINITY_DN24920_c0_g1~~TRINITY_DN24920_c0_g1_i2.p1  ORF type:complete len:1063 (+),score=347.21 TRINITY_DN24920_c0_g1_i2:49-3189(+)